MPRYGGRARRDCGSPTCRRKDGRGQVASDSGSLHGLEGVAWTPDGRLVYAAMDSGNVDLYAVDAQTGERRRLTSDPAADFHPDVSADGTMVTFASERGGASGVWVMSIDGTQPRRLTTGADTRPSFTPDGRWVVVQRDQSDNIPATMWRVSTETGHAERVGPRESIRPVVSPDGRAVAHYWMTPEQWTLAITPIDGELPARTFPISRTHSERVIRWARDGRALTFVDAVGGVPNVWLQPLNGGPVRALTTLSDGSMPAFDVVAGRFEGGVDAGHRGSGRRHHPACARHVSAPSFSPPAPIAPSGERRDAGRVTSGLGYTFR